MTNPTIRIVLAYSGDLATTVAIPWLSERYQAEVVTLTLDVGQGTELTGVRERALAAGAVRAHVIDAREELVRDYILPALQAGVLYDGRYSLAAPLGQALIAKRVVEVAHMEGASAVAHAATFSGAGLAASIHGLDPALTILAFAEISGLSPAAQIDFARTRKLPVAAAHDPLSPASANLWGRSVDAAALDAAESQDGLFTLTRAARDCPDEPADVEIEFDAGLPVRANGIEMPLLELLESLEIIAGAHGVGRVEYATAERPASPRLLHEAPAAVLLSTAHKALRAQTIPADLAQLGEPLTRAYADLALNGQWFAPTREAIDGFMHAVRTRLTGAVRLKLLKGDCQVAAVRSMSAPAARQDSAIHVAEGLIS